MTEQEFHNKRIGFICIDHKIEFIGNTSHKQYLKNKGYSDFLINYNLEQFIRGYIWKKEGFIHIYIGDFEIPHSIDIEILQLMMEYNISQLYLGCNKGNVGEIWKPKLIIDLR